MAKTLIIIAGPTASGKTGVGITLARWLGTEIVSADSRQVYRELPIGTAAPTPEQRAAARHHLIGHRSIHDYYNASMFETEAIDLLEKLFKTKDQVLMVGGSGLYLQAVCQGIDDLPTADHELRQQLLEDYHMGGIESLRLKLKALDPIYYHQVDLKNYRRILKAIEVSIITGRPYSSLLTRTPKERWFQTCWIGLDLEREELYDRINARTDHMFRDRLEEEARRVYPYRHLNALNTVGYKEIFMYFDGGLTFADTVEKIKKNTRNYARKQLTWFRKNKEIPWFRPDEESNITQYIKKQAGI
jgi:tRNA dimethylallyltransferase